MNMKIRLWSDIHAEWSSNKINHIWVPNTLDKDQVLVLAGDFNVGYAGETLIDELCDNFKNVIRILGNHEFYGQDFNRTIEFWKDQDENGPSNFYFLDNDVRYLDGIRFIGGTMWTGFANAHPLVMQQAYSLMADYELIKDNQKLILPEFILGQHKKFKEFLLNELNNAYDGATIVVTHHSPGNGIRLGYTKLDNEPLYFANIEDLIHVYSAESKIKLWLHGHTHQSWDYMISETRVVCNSYGYYGEKVNRSFDKDSVINID